MSCATLTLMNGTLLAIAVVLSTIAALIHVAIFFLESVLWERPKVWRQFGLRSQSDADLLRPMAFNQGFYNLFLAVGTGIGLILLGTATHTGSLPLRASGLWLLLFTLGFMVLASVVLLSTDRRLWRSVLIQGAIPLLAIIILVIGIVTTGPFAGAVV